ncbi:response regulator [Paenibacillus sp. FSL K6-3182]|uniref:response regulator transcription factor n=1 Tax=Paenibacillus sp. FSL K6-3182 TaxID=2921495 RepID=UPI0030D05CF9
MRLKAMLVDDEHLILENLRYAIGWEALGIDIVGVATNGVKALEAAEQLRPDLVLSDIRMPLMDGIVMLQQMRERSHDCEVIMLTGYTEFEYARSVLRSGARDYVLKPINYEELERVVADSARDIRKRKQQQRANMASQGSAIELAYEKMLINALLDSSLVSANKLLHGDNTDRSSLSYLFLLIDLDAYVQDCQIWNEKERALWNFAVRNVLEDTAKQMGFRYVIVQLREGEWCLLLEWSAEDGRLDKGRATYYAARLQESVKLFTSKTISLSCKPKLLVLQELADGYRSLQLALQLTPERSSALIVASDSTRSSNELDVILWQDMEQVIDGLKKLNRVQVEHAWTKLTERLRAEAIHSHTLVDRFLHYLNLHLMRELRDMRLLSEQQQKELWGKLERKGTTKSMLGDVKSIIDCCMQAASSRRTNEVLMGQAKDYISRHIAKDLSIDELADFLDISGSYFSMLFKQYFKETFVEYVTKQRIELAQSFLILSNYAIGEIGKLVGFAERRYFTRVFHKYVGVTPSEYRDLKKDKE